MKDFLSFGIDHQSMYLMSTRFLKGNIYGVSVPPLQLSYIRDTTHPSQKNWLSCVVKYNICGGEIKSWNNSTGRIA